MQDVCPQLLSNVYEWIRIVQLITMNSRNAYICTSFYPDGDWNLLAANNEPGDDGGGAAGKPVASAGGIVVHHIDVVAAVGREGLPLDGNHPRAGKDCNQERLADNCGRCL